MTTNNTTIGINYSDARLRVLVEEYITQQRGANQVLTKIVGEGRIAADGERFMKLNN